MEFTKYQGLGNDFILIDNRQQQELCLTPDRAKALCDRHFGIGADGIIFLLHSPSGDYAMRIINSDGSEPEMCGNGIRCLAMFMENLGIPTIDQTYKITTLAGLMLLRIAADMITVDMGEPRLLAQEIPTTLTEPDREVVGIPLKIENQTWQVTAVNMGNPHCITFVENIDQLNLEQLGPKFEHHSAFPQRINSEFVQIVKPNHLKMRVWERGAGITLACGTGACAVVVAGVLNGFSQRECTVELPGGNLQIHWDQTTNHVLMTGLAQKVFVGQWEP